MAIIKVENDQQQAFFYLVMRMRAAVNAYDNNHDREGTHARFSWWVRNLQMEKVSPLLHRDTSDALIDMQDLRVRFLEETHLLGMSIDMPPFYKEVCTWIGTQINGSVPKFHWEAYELHTNWSKELESKELEHTWWNVLEGKLEPLTTEANLHEVYKMLEVKGKHNTTTSI